MSDETPRWSRKGLDPNVAKNYETVQQLLERQVPVNSIPSDSGLCQSDVAEATPIFNRPADGKVLEHKNTYIVFGRDRPSELCSGFGRSGTQYANTLDIVVGRMSGNRGKCGGAPVDNGTYVGNDFIADAARIYVSQLTEVDTNFGLAVPAGDRPHVGSAIALKADALRLIGREGIKIVTGGALGVAETNSRGCNFQPSPTIDLIAGNFVEPNGDKGEYGIPGPRVDTLQPILKGRNTKDALRDLSQILNEIWSAVNWMAIIQNQLCTTMSACPVGPAPIFGGGGVGPVVSANAAIATNLLSTWVMNPLSQTRNNKMVWERNYLEPYGHKYICSKNVRST
jgi:hypothetical protein